METKSPPPCPKTDVTVRRNPPRRARPTPASAAPLSLPHSAQKPSAIRSFPTQDILSIEVPQVEKEVSESSSSEEPLDSEKLKVFLRIRPIITQHKVGGSAKNGVQKNVWPQNPNRKKDSLKKSKGVGKKSSEICLKANDSHSVTLCPPQSLQDVRRTKSEVYEGFSHVFSAESSQTEVYERMVNPLVEDFLKGRSGMLAAMGPSGSGKTHTVFGSGREPGMVSLALRRIFSAKESNGAKNLRTFYLSMFEIYSERGKGEKIMDLSQDGGDLYMHQSNIKGLHEAIIHDAQQAESLIASGMLKRSTAMTNSNIQSSRSQCIINIRSDLGNIDDYPGDQSCIALLTIVDLAGAEREKRTGNQGARLLESNFINNTSMVFGLCLRSLLEHQRNPKKPFHKHFQNSMLTKYLRDFLEGKKRMALILTAKSGEEDYQDTSYLLRQASPYMNIKFENIEEQPANACGNKRRTQTLPKAEQAKRMKFNSNEVCMDGEVKGGIDHQLHKEEPTAELVREVEVSGSSIDSVKRARENQILSNFSRALWNVLKDYKNKLEASEHANDSLRQSLIIEKERYSALETELSLMKASCSCGKEVMAEVPLVEESGSKARSTNSSPKLERYQSVDVHELNAQVSSSNPVKLECLKTNQMTADTVTSSVAFLPDCFDMVNVGNQVDAQRQVLLSNLGDLEHVDTRLVSDFNGKNPLQLVSASSGCQILEEQCNEKDDVPYEYVVFDKEDLKELEGVEFNNEIKDAGCDTAESVSDSELLVHGDEISSVVKGDQWQHKEEELNAQVSSSYPNESEGFEKQDVLDNILNGQVSSSYASGSQCFEKQDILDDTGISSVEVLSISSDDEKPEEQSNEKIDDLSTNMVSDKQELKEVEEIEDSGVVAGCDTLDSAGQGSVLPSVAGDEISLPSEEDRPKQEEKEENIPISSSNLEEVKCMENQQALVTEIPDQQLVCAKDVINSQGCNAAKLSEVPRVEPCQSSNDVKPKRRLRPASSLLLRNISISDLNDAKGRRGEKDDSGRKRTQGSISLLRLLKQNVH